MIDLMWGMIVFISVFLGVLMILQDYNDRRSSSKKKGYGYGALHAGGVMYMHVFTIMLKYRFDMERLPVFLFLVSAYYCILLLLRPLLRKVANARTCGNLWCFPLISFSLFVAVEALNLGAYRVTIPLPFTIPQYVVWIWVIGFAVCMLWHFVRHMVFRRRLLQNAVRVMDGPLLELWYRQQYICDVSKEYFPLYLSSRLTTPVSVGVWHKTTFVALPDKAYTDEELNWIFRHELIHNGRRHGRTKFMMTMMASLFWFNPLVWVALRKGAEDMELSCDETVVLDYELNERKAYASLLLQTAADHIGFNSSLNGSANSLQYRMKKILKPAEKWKVFTSAVAFGVVNFLACALVVFVSFSGPTKPLREHLQLENTETFAMEKAMAVWNNDYSELPRSEDQEIMYTLLEEEASTMAQAPYSKILPPYVCFWIATETDVWEVSVCDNYVHVEPVKRPGEETWYELSEEFDFIAFASQISPPK